MLILNEYFFYSLSPFLSYSFTSFCYREATFKQLKINIFIAFLSDHFFLNFFLFTSHKRWFFCFFFYQFTRVAKIIFCSLPSWVKMKESSMIHATLIANFSIFTIGILMIDHNLHMNNFFSIYLSNELYGINSSET